MRIIEVLDYIEGEMQPQKVELHSIFVTVPLTREEPASEQPLMTLQALLVYLEHAMGCV